jgi:hypothetical protein
VFLVVFGFHEGDDGVQILEVKTMPCSMRFFASCNGEEGWLELGGATMKCRAWRKTASMKESGRWHPYQEIQDSEAIMVARSSSPG